MATIQSSVKLRETEVNTLAALVLTMNTIHTMIVDSGMIQVASDEYTGQAGIFTAKASPSAGETKVVHAPTSGAAGERLLGYKVYRHPSLLFYIRVNYINFVADRTSTFAALSYQIGRTLIGGAFDPASVSQVFYPQTLSIGLYPLDDLPATINPITISCGADHFWISRKEGSRVYFSSGYAKHPSTAADVLGIGVFSSSKNSSDLCVVLPQFISLMNGGAGVFTEPTSGQSEYSCLRYHVLSGTSWVKRDNGAAGSLSDASQFSTASGTRVAQAELIINGQQHRFNFGFVNLLSVQEFGIINVNLTGVDKRYQALPSLGSSNPATDAMPLNMFSIAVFPTTL